MEPTSAHQGSGWERLAVSTAGFALAVGAIVVGILQEAREWGWGWSDWPVYASLAALLLGFGLIGAGHRRR